MLLFIYLLLMWMQTSSSARRRWRSTPHTSVCQSQPTAAGAHAAAARCCRNATHQHVHVRLSIVFAYGVSLYSTHCSVSIQLGFFCVYHSPRSKLCEIIYCSCMRKQEKLWQMKFFGIDHIWDSKNCWSFQSNLDHNPDTGSRKPRLSPGFFNIEAGHP